MQQDRLRLSVLHPPDNVLKKADIEADALHTPYEHSLRCINVSSSHTSQQQNLGQQHTSWPSSYALITSCTVTFLKSLSRSSTAATRSMSVGSLPNSRRLVMRTRISRCFSFSRIAFAHFSLVCTNCQ